MAFDYNKWRGWLEGWVQTHRAERPDLKLIELAEMTPAVGLGFKTDEVMAGFRLWQNGLVDIEVFSLEADAWLAHEAMILVDDETFELEFSRFLVIAGFAPA